MVTEISLAFLCGLPGWKMAVIYLGAGLPITMVVGWAIGHLGTKNHIEDWVWASLAMSGLSRPYWARGRLSARRWPS